MSLSPGQAAILRALGEGKGLYRNTKGAWYMTDNPWRLNRKHILPSIEEGLIQHIPSTAGSHQLTDRGHEALRALEQEAG